MSPQKDHLENLILIFSGLVTSSGEKKRLTLENYNCGIGFASKGSVPDGMVVDDQGFPRGIFEVKDNTMTPTEATRQGIAEAYNVALGHLKLGVSYSDVMVPIVGSNGYLMELSCMILLEPSFPLVVRLHRVLDLTDDQDLRVAAGFLLRFQEFFSLPLPVPKVLTQTCFSTFGLSTEKYHLKQLKAFFTCKDEFDKSVLHFFRIMRHLYNTLYESTRKHIVFPICVRVDGKKEGGGQIVFPLLDKRKGWYIGLPKSETLRMDFVSSLRLIMNVIHAAGVMHLDFYLSNFMVLEQLDNPEKVFIKIIDWDAAHFISENLSGKSSNRLSDERKTLSSRLGSDNMINYDVSLLNVIEKIINDPRLQSNDKQALDAAFRDCVEKEAKS